MATDEGRFWLRNPFTTITEGASYYKGFFGKGKTVGNLERFKTRINVSIDSVVGDQGLGNLHLQ